MIIKCLESQTLTYILNLIDANYTSNYTVILI